MSPQYYFYFRSAMLIFLAPRSIPLLSFPCFLIPFCVLCVLCSVCPVCPSVQRAFPGPARCDPRSTSIVSGWRDSAAPLSSEPQCRRGVRCWRVPPQRCWAGGGASACLLGFLRCAVRRLCFCLCGAVSLRCWAQTSLGGARCSCSSVPPLPRMRHKTWVCCFCWRHPTPSSATPHHAPRTPDTRTAASRARHTTPSRW